MKLFASVFLVLVLLEQYQCVPCLEWFLPPPVCFYGINPPIYYNPWNPQNPALFWPTYDTSFGGGAMQNGIPYGTPYGGQGSFNSPPPPPQNLTPSGGTVNQAPNETPNGTPVQTPVEVGNGTPQGQAPNETPNETPVQTPVEAGDGTPQPQLFYVTPDGIRETPAEPLDNVCQENPPTP